MWTAPDGSGREIVAPEGRMAEIRDGHGRGPAVGVGLGPVQVTLIFDERDGDLLGEEEVLSGPAAVLRTSW
ncbi:hypothetical protein GCM10009678_80030 [Actinomadura kijaniata]|uniref:Uncharacterized protein n=1 Tax=Actinomadura namibiensis TaxID=182080 RepID=A0A7W3LI35_ACTNM|nr:hypothetical protein [Actinomadura namibiensis]